MTDSMDEWDGGAIDGRDQYIADAPYWSNGDGETIDATDNSEGQVTTENVPDPGEELEADRADGAETDDAEVPTWPPNPETLTELRRRLLNGASTESLGGDWTSASNGALYTAAVGDTFADVEADIPALKTEGDGQATEWVIDEDGETQSELTDDDFETSEPRGSWPPLASCIDNIRRRLVDGSSLREVAKDYDDADKDMIADIAKADSYQGHPVQGATETPPVQHTERDGWVWVREVVDLETDTADNDDPEPETEEVDTAETGGTEAEGAEVPTWPPNPETLTELRRRLLNGEGTRSVGEWIGVTGDTIRYAATGENYSDVDADIPPLTTKGNTTRVAWVVDGDSDGTGATTESELEPEPGTEASNPGADEDASQIDVAPDDERPVARNPPEPERPTVPTRWLVAGVAFVAGWVLSRLVRGGGD